VTIIKRIIGWAEDASNRPKVLISVVLLTLAMLALLEVLSLMSWTQPIRQWLSERPFFGALLFPNEEPAWKDRLAALIPLFGLPIAFLLWHWRDRNVQDQISEQRAQVENARRDINLREFLEVQQRACGVGADVESAGQKTLKTAALYQLRSFMTGEYGQSFQRPAFETVFAQWKDIIEASPLSAVVSDLDTEYRRQGCANINSEEWRIIRSSLDNIRKRTENYRIEHPISNIITEYAADIFKEGIPYRLNSYPFLEFKSPKSFDALDLSGLNFIGSNMSGSTFRNADLTYTRFDFCDLTGCDFTGAVIAKTSFIGANLTGCKFSDAQIGGPRMQGATLQDVDLSGMSISGTRFEGSSLERVSFDRCGGRGTHFSHAHIFGCTFQGAQMGGGAHEFGMIDGTDFRHTTLRSTSFFDCDLTSVKFHDAEFSNVRFHGADLRCAFFTFPIKLPDSLSFVLFNNKTRFGKGNFEWHVNTTHLNVMKEFEEGGFINEEVLSELEKRKLGLPLQT
jgi:uncharacterized protein YjbI with pentapeptide repeats